jgi:hypothetical protein
MATYGDTTTLLSTAEKPLADGVALLFMRCPTIIPLA